LHAEGDCEDELTDCCTEAGEECIEGEVSHDHAVNELQRSDYGEETQEGINKLHPLRRMREIILPHSIEDLLG